MRPGAPQSALGEFGRPSARGQEPPEVAWAGAWPNVPLGTVTDPPPPSPPSSPGCWLDADGWAAGVVVPLTAVVCVEPGRL
jgi:hypothetical protein